MESAIAIVSFMEINIPKKEKRRTIAAALLSLEAAAVLALGGYLIVKSFTSKPEAPGALIGEVVFSFLGGIGLLVAARGFRTNRNYGRAPAVLANLIALGVSYFQIGAHLWIVGIPLAIIALVTLTLALSITPN
jgi:hypothetical protein